MPLVRSVRFSETSFCREYDAVMVKNRSWKRRLSLLRALEKHGGRLNARWICSIHHHATMSLPTLNAEKTHSHESESRMGEKTLEMHKRN